MSLLFVLASSLKREVLIRLLSFFILLRNQYVLLQIPCRMLDIESNYLGCTTSFFKIISTSFSKRKVFFTGKYSLKTVNDPPVSFLSSCIFSIQLFAKSSSQRESGLIMKMITITIAIMIMTATMTMIIKVRFLKGRLTLIQD